MQKWKEKLIRHISDVIRKDSEWKIKYHKLEKDIADIGIHLAVFNEPFLSLIFEGKKSIESRFSQNKSGPYNNIVKGDIVIIKKSGGPIIGFFVSGDIKYYKNTNVDVFKEIEQKYGRKIGTQYDPKFWQARDKCMYITLIKIERLKAVEQFQIGKKDRTAWVVLKRHTEQTLFDDEALR